MLTSSSHFILVNNYFYVLNLQPSQNKQDLELKTYEFLTNGRLRGD